MYQEVGKSYPCPICQDSRCTLEDHTKEFISYYSCPQCGKFGMASGSDGPLITNSPNSSQRKIMSAFIHNWPGEPLVIDQNMMQRLLQTQGMNPLQKLDLLLLYLFTLLPEIGSEIYLKENSDEWKKAEMRSWAANGKELVGLLKMLVDLSYVLCKANSAMGSTTHTIQFKPEGLKRVVELQTAEVNMPSRQAFVAMWFSPELGTAYQNAIEPAIQDAGYVPLRIDAKEHVNKIDDEIIQQIRKSRFLLADFTGHRGGVYYEAGFAHGLGLPVIFTCKEDQLIDLHFDIRQYNCITWSDNNLDDFSTRIQRRIEAILGRG